MEIKIYWNDGPLTEINSITEESDSVRCIRDGTIFDTVQLWKYEDSVEVLNFKHARRVKLIEDKEAF